MTGTGEAVVFWILAPVAVVGALGLVFARRAVYAALSMVLVMIVLGLLYLSQRADFLGVIQVFVYTGAVMMLFIFVVMLIGVDVSDTFVDALLGHRWVSILLAAALGLIIGVPVAGALMPVPAAPPTGGLGSVAALADLIFGPYLWVFEMIGVLLTIAGVAALVLAHRERLTAKPTQREWSRRRIRENRHVAGLPPPGVYARHNAVDTPALLPDGTPSEVSVSRVLRAREQTTHPEEFVDAENEIVREIEEGSQR